MGEVSKQNQKTGEIKTVKRFTKSAERKNYKILKSEQNFVILFNHQI